MTDTPSVIFFDQNQFTHVTIAGCARPIFESTKSKAMHLPTRLMTAIFCVISIAASAQTFPYDFTVFSDPYYDLTAPISISNADVWDDPSYLTSTGFDVQLFDEVTNILAILAPGAQVVNMNQANPDSVQVLAPYYADLINANDSMAVSPISYQIEGPPGNAIFKLEWKNAGFYNEANASLTFLNTTNFQLWLYQNSSIIEFRYGPNTIKSGSLIHFYPTGPLVMLGHNAAFDGSGWEGLWCLSGNPNAPVISPVPSGTQPVSEQALNGEPTSGTVYRFAPMASVVNERTSNAFRLWPTIASNNIFIHDTLGATIEIYDSTGRLVHSAQINSSGPNSVNVDQWPAGYYVVRSSTGATSRFIKS